MHSRLGTVEEALRAIRIPALPALPAPANLAPTEARLTALEHAVRGIVIPAPQQVDLGALMQRLDAIDARLQRAAAPPPAPSVVRGGSRNLLHSAAYGQPDDLKLIKGVAELLEKMLHGIGVYYFWQIAEWLPGDVAHADAQLTAFHGRIERDDWVTQSAEFARAGNAARRPVSL